MRFIINRPKTQDLYNTLLTHIEVPTGTRVKSVLMTIVRKLSPSIKKSDVE